MHKMRPEDVRELVRQNRFGILSLTHDGNAYGIPLFYAYDGGAIYFHTLPGAKLRYIATTREACFTISIVRTIDEWASAQVFGHIELIDDTPHELAGMHALMAVPLPPEFGFTKHGEPKHADKSAI
ncbi:MAG: pyridoxamine 5'-phosphate oxidase family protein [Candidatus Thermoplasmatota archaeon]